MPRRPSRDEDNSRVEMIVKIRFIGIPICPCKDMRFDFEQQIAEGINRAKRVMYGCVLSLMLKRLRR